MVEGYTIITNNVPRDVREAWSLNGEELDALKKEFDYIDWEQVEAGEWNFAWITYKGENYDLGDFQSVSELSDFHEFRKQKWDGFRSDSYFSGILMKWVPGTNWEQVIMGRYYT